MAKDVKTTIAERRKELQAMLDAQKPRLERAKEISAFLKAKGEDTGELDDIIRAASAFITATGNTT